MNQLTECKTTCPYCGVGCGIIAKSGQNGLVSVEGDPEHPANFGKLCSKGSALAETMTPENRLLEPIVNKQTATWDIALTLISEKIKDALSHFGRDSVAFYVSGQLLTEDYYVANKLMKGFIGSANIDTNSRLCMASSVAGHKRAFGSDTVPVSYEDLESADLVVLVGSNLAWCHPILYQRLAAAKELRPDLKVVVIDPRQTATTELADLHLPIDPDGDVSLFIGLINHLINSGVCDTEFIENHTDGFEKACVQNQRLTIEEVSPQCGLEPKLIKAFFDLFQKTDKTVTIYSQGVNQSRTGTDKVNAILNCHLITGRIGKPGCGPFSITGQPNAMGGREVGGLANMLAAHMELDNPDHRQIVQTFWNSPYLPEKQGLKAVEMFDAVDRGEIKVLWIMATNPVDSLPESEFVKKALAKCPFVIVSDIYSNTDTNQYAHVLLPSAGWGEKDGTVTNSERRISRQRQFLTLPGCAKPDWWQLAKVGQLLGYREAFTYSSVAEIYREHAALSAQDNNGTRDFNIGAHSQLTNKEYDNLTPVRWPVKSSTIGDTARFFEDGKFFTSNTRAKILCISVPEKKRLKNQFHLNSGRIRDQWHTMTRTGRSARLSAHLSEPFAEINPLDAEILKISVGDILELSNEYGCVKVRALITSRQKSGHLFVPIHWTDQHASNARINSLLPKVTDPYSGQPALKNARVSATKYNADLYFFLISQNRPSLPKNAYWSCVETEGGWRTEYAGPADLLEDFERQKELFNLQPHSKPMIYEDKTHGQIRIAWLSENKIDAVIYAANEPVHVSRSWVCSKLTENFNDPLTRHRLIAGRAPGDEPEKGAIICSCFGVGTTEIVTSIRAGCRDVNAVGNKTKAGTNCGSCRSEIATLIQQNSLLAAQ
ncbi:nitrate reductase [Sneathiella glossodoripedis]|uniref:nitrate reductase n=1 Tax=Sneathiella glossodoripedis TaxID=418853 RepID=UPI000470D399|nr:nitrate reductase [Sneathiella glossodoripedis]